MNNYIKAGLMLATIVLGFTLVGVLVRLFPAFGTFVVFVILAMPAYFICLGIVSLLDSNNG